jgi:PAS domain S-box-containing protein
MNNVPMDHESIFEHIYALAPIGIGLVSIDGHFMKANPALCRILGYTKTELQALTFQQITHPADVKETAQYRSELLEGGFLSKFELDKRYIHKQGHLIWASLHASLVLDEKTGKPLYFISHIIDISEKKKTERMYKLISENTKEIIYCSDAAGTCYYCSHSSIELLGYEPDELIGKNNNYLIHPDDYEQMKKLNLADAHILQYRYRHKDGRYIWFETTYQFIEDENGNQNVLAVGRDITERKKNEDLLAEAQKIASIGSSEWDMVRQEISLSDQLYEMFHLDRNVKIHSPFEFVHLVHPNDQDYFRHNIEQAFVTQKLDFEFRHVTTDGLIRYMHARGLMTLGDDGRPVKMHGTVQDITERKQAELKLQESVERYTSLKKYNHDAVISLDLKGNIIHGNAVAERLTGYRISELAGQSASLLIGRQHLYQILSKSFHDATVENYINRFMHQDGHEVEVLTTIAPIIINKENVGFYIIAKDITEQKKLLIAKETAERTNKAKSEFLAMMSHEIRTPMNGVLGMADLLSEADNLSPDQREYVEIIRKSGTILLAIINDILDFSKIDSGKTELTEQTFDVRDCITETFDLLSAKAREKHLEMRSSYEPEIPDSVIGDPERLKQVLMNLIGNAIKFTDSGSVSVSVKPAVSKSNSVNLEFTVQDTGIGIPPHEADRLFEPFYQVNHSLNRSYEGTGLGLAISKKLVQLMGGKIRLLPSEPPGATLAFTVPFKPIFTGESAAEQKQEEPAALPVSLNILVAEDNHINQKVITRMLEKIGHAVTLADDGNQAVQLTVNGAYDMIFMDVYMPFMDGFDATKAIKQQLPSDRSPVIIAMTANALIGDREKCLAAGMDEYVSKPITMESVSRIIRQFF